MTWQYIALGNLLTGFTYLLIAWLLASRLHRTRQLSLRANPVGVALVLVFLTGAARSLWPGLHMLLPLVGIERDSALELREGWTWGSVPLPFLTAVAGVFYLWMRRHGKVDTGEASLSPDLALRRRRALEINDNVVQGLIAARELDALGQTDEAREVAERTLQQAQRMMDGLVEVSGRELRPGDLRRSAPSAAAADAR